MSIVKNPTTLQTRILWCKITLQSGEFTSGGNTAVIVNKTVEAQIHKSLSKDFINSANITIYGMDLSDIANLSTTGFKPLVYNPNKIELYAQYQGDVANQSPGQVSSLCFSGFIVKAWPDLSNVDRPMYFECDSSYLNAINNAEHFNAQGALNISDIFKSLATDMGYPFQNNGVNGIVENPILQGSQVDQIKYLAEQTSTNCVIDNGILKISPVGFGLTKEILDVNSDSGLLGYPMVDNWGVKLKIRYNPSLQIGQYISLETSVKIPNSTGKWFVYDMQSVLNNNHENWYSDLHCSYNNLDFS